MQRPTFNEVVTMLQRDYYLSVAMIANEKILARERENYKVYQEKKELAKIVNIEPATKTKARSI